MALSDVRVTTEVLWKGALVFALLDVVFVAILRWRISAPSFRILRWPLLFTTGCFWFLLLLILMSGLFWESVYHHVFPPWARWLIPPAYSLLFAATGWLFWWLAMRLPGHPVINWCLLGGMWGTVTHAWAIYRGLLDKVPMLQGASPAATVIMPAFEFSFYYCVILSIAAFLHRRRTPRSV